MYRPPQKLVGRVSPFPSPPLVLSLAPVLLVSDPSVMLLPSPVGWTGHNHPSVGRERVEGKDQKLLQTWRGENGNAAPASVCCSCKKDHFCRSCPECWSWRADVLPCPGLTPGCGHEDKRCRTSCHAPFPLERWAQGQEQEGKRGDREVRNQQGN